MFAHVHERGHRLGALVPAWIEREDVPLEQALKQPYRDVAVAEKEPAFRVAAGDREVQLLVERPRRLEMAGVYNSPTSVDLPNLADPSYIDRVNRAVDFVTAHLGERIRLEDVADAACFSPFHFHRVSPMSIRKTRWKWNGEKHAASATSSSRIRSPRWAVMKSTARFTRSM